MLYTLSANKPAFKSLTLRNGMNIILADRHEPSDKALDHPQRRTRNGAGKSSVIDLVHFILGGKPEGALSSEALSDWVFALSLDVGDDSLTVQRGLIDPKVISVSYSSGKKQELSLSSWSQYLGRAWFQLENNKHAGAASFRQLISYFARRRRDGGFDDPTRTFRAQNNAVIETNLAVLFGLDAEIVRRFHKAKIALKQNEAAQKTLRDLDKSAPSGARRIDLEAQLSAQIAAAALARDHLKERIESFNVLPAFRELEHELASLNQLGRELSDSDVLDEESIDVNRQTLASEKGMETPQLQKLFAEAEIVFSDRVVRQYEEVVQFHHRLIENRRSHLQSEIEAAEKRIKERQPQRERLEVRRGQIIAALRASGPADELLRLRDELAEKEAIVRGLEARLAEARSLEEHGEHLQRELEECVRALRQDRRERSPIVDLASRTFSEISERLYETPGQLAISASEYGLRFLPSTPADQSAGVMSMQIFCFDFTIASLCKSRGLGPGFLMHDSHIFEPVDGRQFARALRIAADFSREMGIQYVVTLNSDELARAEKEGQEDFRSFVVEPTLSDTPEGGLFGMRFD